MAFDHAITDEEALAARRLAILRPAPLKPLPPIDHDAIRKQADALEAAGLRPHGFEGLQASIELANQHRLRNEP